MEIFSLILNNSHNITIWILIGIVFRAFFAFGWLMRAGQALIDLERKIPKPVLMIFSVPWLIAMLIATVIDILTNITLMTILYLDLPSAWNETYSYRLGRYRYEPQHVNTWRYTLSMPIVRILTFLEGHDHVEYIWYPEKSPYPDLKVLF